MPGSFDWTPHLPMMYARIIKNLELPVYFKGARNASRETNLKQFDFASIGRWMVSTLVSSIFKLFNKGKYSIIIITIGKQPGSHEALVHFFEKLRDLLQSNESREVDNAARCFIEWYNYNFKYNKMINNKLIIK
jgi:hypothetical protein